MNIDEIIELVLSELNDREIYFTTKNDPTIQEPSDYYELNEYGDLTDKAKEIVAKDVQSYVGDGAVVLSDAIDMWIEDSLCNFTLDFTDNLRTQFKQKEIVPGTGAYKVKTESSIKKLREATINSLDELNNKINSEDFDLESNEGKIILKTKEIFEKLTDLGYNLIVNLDNGESETSILLGDQGGKVIITITDSNKPIKAFASGNFELTDANLEVLENIKENLEEV